jgi:hypothetical protein
LETENPYWVIYDLHPDYCELYLNETKIADYYWDRPESEYSTHTFEYKILNKEVGQYIFKIIAVDQAGNIVNKTFEKYVFSYSIKNTINTNISTSQGNTSTLFDSETGKITTTSGMPLISLLMVIALGIKRKRSK